MAEMMAARSTREIVFRTKCAMAVSAPVLPELTQADARPSFTRSMATRMEEFFFRRIASRGESPMATTPAAGAISALARMLSGQDRNSESISAGSPTNSTRRAASSCSARDAPATYSRGCWSPLITSMAIGSTRERQDLSNRDRLFGVFDFGRLLDHALAAIEAIRSDPVAQVGLTRLRVDGERGLLEAVVRTVHTARRGRLAALLNGHCLSYALKRNCPAGRSDPLNLAALCADRFDAKHLSTTGVSTARRAVQTASVSLLHARYQRAVPMGRPHRPRHPRAAARSAASTT